LQAALIVGSFSGHPFGFGFAAQAGVAAFGAAGGTCSAAGVAPSPAAASAGMTRGSGTGRSVDTGAGFELPHAANASSPTNPIRIG
jgi:hypothetical protein